MKVIQADETAGLAVCVLADDETVKATIEQHCLGGSNMCHFPLKNLLDARGFTTPQAEEVLAVATSSGAVLVEWNILYAPLISALGQRLRGSGSPLIALCSKDEQDQVAALVSGADHVLTPPFPYARLRAQLMAHARSVQLVPQRGGGDSSPAVGYATGFPQIEVRPPERRAGVGQTHVGPLTLDVSAHRFYIAGKQVQLTERLFKLLAFLMYHVDELLTRERILEEVWGIDFDPSTNVVDVSIHAVRRMLQAHGLTPSIETVRSKGYRFVVPSLCAA